MKTIVVLISMWGAVTTVDLRAQNFNAKTDDVYLNFKNPAGPTTGLPFVKWTVPSLENTNSTVTRIVIEATVESDVALKSLMISVSDGKSTPMQKNMDVVSGKLQTIKQPLNLLDGMNYIEIVAENVNGGKIGSTRTILVGKDAIADAVSIDRKDYALFFATDKYDNWDDLVNPVEDAHSVADVLSKKYGFLTEIVENPTQDEVGIKIREYTNRKFKPQDQLLIFFAGHGYFDDTFNEGYVVAKNSLKVDPAKNSYISHVRLRSLIDNIPSEHIFLLMDVCFGGTFDPVVARSRSLDDAENSDRQFLVRKLTTKTRKYLTSGGKVYVSDGIPGQHSPFTLKLLQALNDGGGGDRILTISELRTYVEKLVPEPRTGGFGDDKLDSDFVFVLKNR
jgi:hypothetical protein